MCAFYSSVFLVLFVVLSSQLSLPLRKTKLSYLDSVGSTICDHRTKSNYPFAKFTGCRTLLLKVTTLLLCFNLYTCIPFLHFSKNTSMNLMFDEVKLRNYIYFLISQYVWPQNFEGSQWQLLELLFFNIFTHYQVCFIFFFFFFFFQQNTVHTWKMLPKKSYGFTWIF